MLGSVAIAYRVFVLNETVRHTLANSFISVQPQAYGRANDTVAALATQPESAALPAGSFLALLLATAVGHKALTTRGTPSPIVLMVFLLLELGFVVASTFVLISISMESKDHNALMADIPKVWSCAPCFTVAQHDKHFAQTMVFCPTAPSYFPLSGQVVVVGLSVAGLFISIAAIVPAYQLRAACMPNANQKRR